MAFPSTINSDLPAPSYIIYRDVPAGQPYDPTAPPVFFPPKDSDELFDALRAKYPHVKSHSERMRDAMIEFLIHEREEQQVKPTPVTTACLSDSFTPTDMPSISPWLQSSSSNSAFSSPETLELSTPSLGMSPLTPHRSFSTAASTTAASPALVGPTPPAIEQMTGVFSVSATEQPKQRMRRKMTEAEKIEYRKRRIVKACDKCSKRKRKCNHNQPEMEKLVAKQIVTKATPSRPHSKAVAQTPAIAPDPQLQPDIVDFDSFMSDDPWFNTDSLFDNDMQLFDGVIDLPKDPQYNFDHAWQFDQLGMTATSSRRTSDDQQQPDFDHFLGFGDAVDRINHDGRGMEATTGGRNLQTPTSANNANMRQALAFDQVLGAQWDYNASCQTGSPSQEPFSTVNTHGNPHRVPAADQLHQPSDGTGNEMLWEHLRTGQIEPTHTAHVHDSEGSASYVFDSTGRSGSGSHSSRNGEGILAHARPSWAQTVLRLTGTMKAIRAFGNLAKTRKTRSSLQSIPLSKAALLVSLAAARAVAQQLHPQSAVNRANMDNSPTTFEYNDGRAVAPQPWHGHDNHLGLPCHGGSLALESHVIRKPDVNSPFEGMPINDYFPIKMNIWAKSNAADVSGMSADLFPRDSKQIPWNVDLSRSQVRALSSAPSHSNELLLESANSDRGRHVPPVFGELIDRAPSLAAEMFMLKRRIPKVLHSIVGCSHRDRRCAESEPPLQIETLRERMREVLLSHNPSDGDNATGVAGTSHLRLITGTSSRADAALETFRFEFASTNNSAPMHTRLRSLLSSESSAGPSVLQHKLADATQENTPLQTPSPIGRMGGHARAAAALPWQAEDRLSDHVRRRDHFGRSWTPILGALLLLAALLHRVHCAGSVDFSLVLFALLSPVPITRGDGFRPRCGGFRSMVYGPISKCTIKNSSWLGALGFPAAESCSRLCAVENRRKEEQHGNMFLG
ncbi:hypothetical protein M433DRAFT_532583 [Acidomyces richmondensis BFW]|nr:MAG: hypothetical protein FE78DRAFT_337957 [Acidomyces sp. 'richmondensis']KYG46865.1 hypothetical protein M433DRAFT_532583 [Acidomyces richmondensis BFW]